MAVKKVNFRNTIKRILFGSSLLQDYLCVGVEGFDAPLLVYLTSADRSFRANINSCHIFLGYNPLVMAVTFKKSSDEAAWCMRQERVCFSFVQRSFTIDCRWKGFSSDQGALARLVLKKIKTLDRDEYTAFILEGEFGEHQFLSSFHHWTNRIREKLKRHDLGNVNLPGNLHDQVSIAYAIPRIISIITVVDHDRMNMFPTDLHGPVDGKFYLSSLRIGGKANDQVERSETIVISNVDVGCYRNAGGAGKNHMMDPLPRSKFKLSSLQSKIMGIPPPEKVLTYKELNRTGSFDVGIHRIHSYEIVSDQKIEKGEVLAHVHRFYAQWRLNNNLSTKIFLR